MSDAGTETSSLKAVCKWSAAEKKIARRAFDRALGRGLEALLREAKDRVSRIGHAPELWDFERWLTQQRQRIDHTFDFRYSVLLRVFATLLRDGRLEEGDLHGLADDKIQAIRHLAGFRPPDRRAGSSRGNSLFVREARVANEHKRVL